MFRVFAIFYQRHTVWTPLRHESIWLIKNCLCFNIFIFCFNIKVQRTYLLRLTIYDYVFLFLFWLTPSSLPCRKCTAPERCMPVRNHTGCVSSRRSIRLKSQGGHSSVPCDVSLEVSPSAKMPPSELETRDVRDCKERWEVREYGCIVGGCAKTVGMLNLSGILCNSNGIRGFVYIISV